MSQRLDKSWLVLVSYYSGRSYETQGDATDAARRAVPWFAPLVPG
jgi:hypothetical protein